MTKEKILERLVNIQIGEGSYFDMGLYRELIHDIEQDIREENNKTRGLGNLNKLAKAIFKSASTNRSEMMQYANTVNGVQYVLDGYRIAGFYNALDLPEWSDTKDPRPFYDIAKILDNVEYDDEAPLELPTVSELKTEIKLAKAKNPKKHCFIWKFENGPAVNAQFLLDFMQAYTDMRIYASAINKLTYPLYIESEYGMGILLPIKCTDEMRTGLSVQ